MHHLSLFELNELIKSALSEHLQPSYWVVAEIGEMRVAQKGHCYMELVDKSAQGSEIIAKIRANIWSYAFRSISAYFEGSTGEPLRAGMKVLANVQVQFHSLYGLSLNIKDIDPNYTLGERQKQKQATIEKLKADGVFDMNKQLRLPLVPQRIALISSASAAGYGDFINHIESNEYGYTPHIELYNCIMQGSESAASIINALHEVNEQAAAYDVVIIIRGGGAQVDLDSFDHYELCFHIAQMPIPVITGIGHERDETIADLVAHTKMKTPTAVAEFIIRGFMHYESQLLETMQQIAQLARNKMNQEQNQIGLLEKSIRIHAKSIIKEKKTALEMHKNNIAKAAKQLIKTHEQKIIGLEKQIQLNNPDYLFQKGYSYSEIDGVNIGASTAVKKGAKLRTIHQNVEIWSEIEKVNKR